jgi:hypothetical protein
LRWSLGCPLKGARCCWLSAQQGWLCSPSGERSGASSMPQCRKPKDGTTTPPVPPPPRLLPLNTSCAVSLLQRPTEVAGMAVSTSQRLHRESHPPSPPANSCSASTRRAVRMSRSTRPTTEAVRRTIFSPTSFGDPPSMAGGCVSTPPCTTASPSRMRSGTAVRWSTGLRPRRWTYFSRFTASADVIAHELTHGVTQLAAALGYHGQTGALNEHLSDAFGSWSSSGCSARPRTSRTGSSARKSSAPA